MSDRGSWKHSDRLIIFLDLVFFFSCFTLPDPALRLLLRDSALPEAVGASYGRAGQGGRPFSATMELRLFGYALRLSASQTRSKNKGHSFIDCSPRTRGQGGRHGLEWAPVTLAREARRPTRGTPEEYVDVVLTCICDSPVCSSIVLAYPSLRCKRTAYFQSRESACGPPAPWWGAAQAAAGRATVVKLQTISLPQCLVEKLQKKLALLLLTQFHPLMNLSQPW